MIISCVYMSYWQAKWPRKKEERIEMEMSATRRDQLRRDWLARWGITPRRNIRPPEMRYSRPFRRSGLTPYLEGTATMLLSGVRRHIVGLLAPAGSDMTGFVVYDGHHNETGWVWIRCASDLTLSPVAVHPSRVQAILPDAQNGVWQFARLP